jgi:sugar lactone lactonase YvrE
VAPLLDIAPLRVDRNLTLSLTSIDKDLASARRCGAAAVDARFCSMHVPTPPTLSRRPAASSVVATWPEGTFLENLSFARDGTLLVTAYTEGQLHRVDVATGERGLLAALDFYPLGIAHDVRGGVVLSGHRQLGFEVRAPHTPDGFWYVEPDGKVRAIANAVGARFLNGLTPLGDGSFVCADSSGAVWQVDPRTNAVSRVSGCAELSPVVAAEPLPAANGIKVHDGYLYVSNWVRATVLRAPLADLSRFERVHEGVIIDDFAFSRDGAIFGASHMANVVCLEPDGTRWEIGGPEELVHGATACALGPDDALYVITDGGSVAFHLGIAPALEPARLVRLDVQRAAARVS